MDERREDASVEIPESLFDELADGGLGREAVELLSENHLVQRKSDANVYETGCPA